MTKEAILLHLETILLVKLSLCYRHYSYISNAYNILFRLPPHPPPTTTKISTTVSTHRWVSSKLTDSIKIVFPYFSTKNYVIGIQNTVSLGRFCENLQQMLNFRPKDKLWVHKRTVSMRRFFCAPKTNVQTDG